MQLTVAKDIVAKDGVGALYKGLSAGLLRQATYTTARLGIFNSLSIKAKEWNNGQNLPLWQKAACGLTAGGLGALVGTPADLTLIRMQADNTLPLDQRRNYKGVGDAMVRCVMMGLFAVVWLGPRSIYANAQVLSTAMWVWRNLVQLNVLGVGDALHTHATLYNTLCQHAKPMQTFWVLTNCW